MNAAKRKIAVILLALALAVAGVEVALHGHVKLSVADPVVPPIGNPN